MARPRAGGLSRWLCLVLAGSTLLAADLCGVQGFQSGSPAAQVLVLSDSPALFRPASTEHSHAHTQGGTAPISPRGVAAAAAALLGVPSPPGTDSATAREVSALLAPNPFLHAPLVLVLALRGAPPLPDGWLQQAAFGQQEGRPGVQVVQRRELSWVEGSPLGALKRELSVVRLASEGSLRVYPDSEWERTSPSKTQDEEAWDAALLAGDLLGSKDEHGYSAASLAASFGPTGEAFVHDVVQVAKLVEVASSPSAQESTPALVAASISVAGLQWENAGEAVHALEAAVAVVVDSTIRNRRDQGPVALVLVLDSSKGAEQHDLGLLLPAGADAGLWDAHGRVLSEAGDTEGETPQQVEVKALYVIVWLILLTAIVIGLWLMFAMNVTKDTLLYSGAKVD